MTSQNFPNEAPDPRVPKIIEERLKGATWEEVGLTVGLTRRAIYDIRQKDEYRYILDVLAPKVDKMFEEILEGDHISYRLEAGKEINRMRRALMTKRVHTQEDYNATATRQITEDRKEKDNLVKQLDLSPDQYRVLEDSVKDEK